ncbi:Uncharacterized protein SCF082_LOCUS43589, partial [Durusdinium trenchii]
MFPCSFFCAACSDMNCVSAQKDYIAKLAFRMSVFRLGIPKFQTLFVPGSPNSLGHLPGHRRHRRHRSLGSPSPPSVSAMCRWQPRNLRGLIKVTERSVTPLLSAWSSMPHLRKLHLNLTQTRVSSDSASELCESLKELRELEILKLYFTDCASVGDAAASSLGRSFEALPLAESIICFSGTQLSDTGMTSLCSGLTTLLSMTRLTLRFRHCGRRLSPASLWDLGESLASLVRLEKLVVDFGKCQGIPRHVAKRYAGN